MDPSTLFNALPLPPTSTSQHPDGEVLLNFRAGKLNWDGKRVVPDKRRGMIQLLRGANDGLVHCYWIDRDDDKKEDDLIIIGDAYMDKIDPCKSGRSYVIRFTSSNRKFLLWMQESDIELDALNVDKFNRIAGGKPPAVNGVSKVLEVRPAGGGSGDSGTGSGAGGSSDSLNLTTAASSSSSSSSSTGSSSNPSSQPPPSTSSLSPDVNQLAQLMLSEMSKRSGASPRVPETAFRPMPLSSLLTTKRLLKLIDDPEACKELTSHLPPDYTNRDHLINTINSAQLSNAMSSLTQVVYSNQLNTLLLSMGIKLSDCGLDLYSTSDPMEIFVTAIEHAEAKTEGGPPNKKTRGDDTS